MAEQNTEKAERSTAGLVDVLFDAIDGIRDGSCDVQDAMAISNLAKQVINTFKARMEFSVNSSRIQDFKASMGSEIMLGGAHNGNKRSAPMPQVRKARRVA